jgi:DNA-binding transcriptional ArsR family regulator
MMPRALAASGPMANLKRVLWHLLGGTRGGPMRIRIVRLLRERPLNTNQVSVMLGIDYKTAEHHLRVLRENRVATPHGDGYGAVFRLTRDMEASLDEFERIAAHVAVPARGGAGRPPPAPPSAGDPASAPSGGDPR